MSPNPGSWAGSLNSTGVLGRCACEHLEHLASSGDSPVLSHPVPLCRLFRLWLYSVSFLFGILGSSQHPVNYQSLLSKMEVPKGHTAQMLSGRASAFPPSSTPSHLLAWPWAAPPPLSIFSLFTQVAPTPQSYGNCSTSSGSLSW